MEELKGGYDHSFGHRGVLDSYSPGLQVLRAPINNTSQNALHRAYKCTLRLLESDVIVSCGVVADPSHYLGQKFPKTSLTTATNTTFTITTYITIIMQGVIAS